MSDVVHSDAETLDGSHAEQCPVARFAEDNFVYRFETLGTEDGITRFARDSLLGGRGEAAFPDGRYFDANEHISRQASQFRASVAQCFDSGTDQSLLSGLAGHHAHVEHVR